MIGYYTRVAIRGIRLNKFYSGICIIGLGLAFCAALLIGLYVNDELNYDRWMPGYDSVYRINVIPLNNIRYTAVPSDTGLWMRQDFPQIEEVTRLIPTNEIVSAGELEFRERIYWADANVFAVFQFQAVAGELASALQNPDGVAIDQSIAEKYFPSSNPIGQLLEINGEQAMRVMAVFETLPSNTHARPRIIAAGHASISRLAEQDNSPVVRSFGTKSWATRTYVKLAPGVSVDRLENDLPMMLDRHLPVESGRKNSEAYRLELMPLSDIHLSPVNANLGTVDRSGIYAVSAIAFLIVLTAAINFVNLMTARGLKRSMEVGMRKTVGAGRRDLTHQFMVETVIHVLLGALLALLLTTMLLPIFNSFLLRTIETGEIWNGAVLIGILIAVLLTCLLSSFYPTLVAASYSPQQAFHASKSDSRQGYFRQLLSVIQFAILGGLIIGTIVIYEQVQFGTREAIRQLTNPVVIISTDCSVSFKQALNELPGVIGTSCANEIPQLGLGSGTGMSRTEGDAITVYYTSVDPNFFDLYQLSLLAGRGFTDNRAGDRSPQNNEWNVLQSIVIDESTARNLDFHAPADAIGEVVTWRHLFRLPGTMTPLHDAEIIGVVEDFQVGSIRSGSRNAVFFYDPGQMAQINVQIHGEQLPETLTAIDRIWDDLDMGGPIARRFFDEEVDSMYRSTIRQSQLLTVYAAVAIFIAMLGLVGLAAFVAEKRTKEIGIRKVVGGSRLSIIAMLLWQFSKPVLLSNLLAWPVAYYLLTQWLATFQRQIDLQWWMFVSAAVATALIALITVFAHSYTYSGANPIKSLRYE
ncbi:MAG: ABC transporter permease [Pseudomonadales bacterium]|nr:ABC transporter permease [Pseudomonadales bacterium]